MMYRLYIVNATVYIYIYLPSAMPLQLFRLCTPMDNEGDHYANNQNSVQSLETSADPVQCASATYRSHMRYDLTLSNGTAEKYK